MRSFFFFYFGVISMSYLRRIAKTILTSVVDIEKIASEAMQEVANVTEKIATEVEKPAKKS